MIRTASYGTFNRLTDDLPNTRPDDGERSALGRRSPPGRDTARKDFRVAAEPKRRMSAGRWYRSVIAAAEDVGGEDDQSVGGL